MMDEKEIARIKELRRKIIGAGIMAYLKSSEDDLHLKYNPPEQPK